MSSLKPEARPEEPEEQKCIDHLEPDFQEAIDKILSSHDSARSRLKTATEDHLAKLQEKFDLALRVSALNPDEQDVTRLVLNGMFDNINETLEEVSQSSHQVMQQNLDVARQSMSGLSKTIRSTFGKKEKLETKSTSFSKSDFKLNLAMYLWMGAFILTLLIFSVFSEGVIESYKNISHGERFVQSVLIMSFTFALYYLRQFQ